MATDTLDTSWMITDLFGFFGASGSDPSLSDQVTQGAVGKVNEGDLQAWTQLHQEALQAYEAYQSASHLAHTASLRGNGARAELFGKLARKHHERWCSLSKQSANLVKG